MKGFLYILFGFLFLLSFKKEKSVLHTAETKILALYEDNYAEIEIDDETIFAPFSEGCFSRSHGKSRRTTVSVEKSIFISKTFEQLSNWLNNQFSLCTVWLKSISQTLVYKTAYQRLLLFQFVLI